MIVFFFITLFLFFPYSANSYIVTNRHIFNFSENNYILKLKGDAFLINGELQLTKNQSEVGLRSSIGRATSAERIPLLDQDPINNPNAVRLTDFTTHFSFRIEALDNNSYGDGLAFFIEPYGTDHAIPQNSSGGYFGLFSPETADNSAGDSQIVVVELDSFKNEWDPSSDHMGININSIISVNHTKLNSSIKDGRLANAWISYNSTTHNLSVFLTYANDPVFNGNCSLWRVIDLTKFVTETVQFGLSAATGQATELHTIVSWDYTYSYPSWPIYSDNSSSRLRLIAGIAVPICVLSLLLGLFIFIRRKRSKTGADKDDGSGDDETMDDEFEKGTGPKKFSFADLTKATNNFLKDGKLGEGGFGGVYKGLLSASNTEIAVKRISRGSTQGKKEYASEVRIISRLRHRNLVQLIGWCHEKQELLLVYEYMPNGSLDSHLFGKKDPLTWVIRFKVALGLASAMLYLHEEWEQCVVHRDIKSSNVMLDSEFNAKLGDFGLARFVGHGLGSQTTVLAGTMGYLAPECLSTGKSSTESDVYSFGVVALEIACGRKAIEPREDPSKVRLVEFVWDLYGKGELLEAVDVGLNMEFDETQVECLMIVGLWCCHPDFARRPTIRQVINVLNLEAPLPNLPSKLPVPMYYAPPMDISRLMYTSSSGFVTDSEKYTQSSTSTTDSSITRSPSIALLHAQIN